MKFIIVIFVTALATVSLGTVIKSQKTEQNQNLVSPTVAGANNSTNSVTGWQIFVNNYYGYKIKHPTAVDIKNKKSGNISLVKGKSINILITQDVLLENDTLNTAIEKNIETKKVEMKDKFILTNTISPIALGQDTAQTYSSEENGQKLSYYYVPQKDKKYLLITNLSPHDGGADFLTSEDIIYSLEFLP